jgi:nicotinate dehydrogenase subunit A
MQRQTETAMADLIVNGVVHTVNVPSGVPLIYTLRNALGLKSVKLGCGLEQCGACTVLVDGMPSLSCVATTESFEGRRIETVEGLENDGDLHPVQRALLGENAAQCGYCLSGILMAAKALFDRTSTPSRDEIRGALDEHLCRCGAHPRILRALERLAGHG